MYTKGLETCGDNSSLTRESAVLLTNRSNVYSSMGMHRESLKDANEAIRVDNSWFKVLSGLHLVDLTVITECVSLSLIHLD